MFNHIYICTTRFRVLIFVHTYIPAHVHTSVHAYMHTYYIYTNIYAYTVAGIALVQILLSWNIPVVGDIIHQFFRFTMPPYAFSRAIWQFLVNHRLNSACADDKIRRVCSENGVHSCCPCKVLFEYHLFHMF